MTCIIIPRVGGENVAYLLCAGQHECRLVPGVEGPGVSLLPLGGKVANISTTVNFRSSLVLLDLPSSVSFRVMRWLLSLFAV